MCSVFITIRSDYKICLFKPETRLCHVVELFCNRLSQNAVSTLTMQLQVFVLNLWHKDQVEQIFRGQFLDLKSFIVLYLFKN